MSGFGDTPPDLDCPGFGTPPRNAPATPAPAGSPPAPAGPPPVPAGPSPAPAPPAPAGPSPAPIDAPPAPAPSDAPPATTRIAVRVNGTLHTLEVEPRTLLSDCLRHGLGLTGTKVGCEHGVCGACTVQLDGEPVRSCLTFAVQVDGAHVTTIEGLPAGPLQASFHEHHALQCGFCTAGMLMTLDAYLADHPEPSEEELKTALAGNLCRCTGYAPIVKAVLNR